MKFRNKRTEDKGHTSRVKGNKNIQKGVKWKRYENMEGKKERIGKGQNKKLL